MRLLEGEYGSEDHTDDTGDKQGPCLGETVLPTDPAIACRIPATARVGGQGHTVADEQVSICV